MRSKYWIVTWQCPDVSTVEDTDLWQQDWVFFFFFYQFHGLTYGIYQLERGEEGGNLHWQGYLCFNTVKRMSTVKNFFPGEPHLEKRQGTHSQAKVRSRGLSTFELRS